MGPCGSLRALGTKHISSASSWLIARRGPVSLLILPESLFRAADDARSPQCKSAQADPHNSGNEPGRCSDLKRDLELEVPHLPVLALKVFHLLERLLRQAPGATSAATVVTFRRYPRDPVQFIGALSRQQHETKRLQERQVRTTFLSSSSSPPPPLLSTALLSSHLLSSLSLPPPLSLPLPPSPSLSLFLSSLLHSLSPSRHPLSGRQTNGTNHE